MNITRPMLAADPNKEKNKGKFPIRFPVLASPKLDGIRCLVLGDGSVVSRRLKPIPNAHIRKTLGAHCPHFMDGELMLPGMEGTFQDVTSTVMSHDGGKDWCYYVFDTFHNPSIPYQERYEYLQRYFKGLVHIKIKLVPHEWIEDKKQLRAYEAKCLAQGHEGVMIRDPHGPYKCGRSTAREGYLLKIKRFTDSEAIVTGCVEKETNLNEAKTNELGYTKRSSHKANKKGVGTLGAFACKDIKTGVDFMCGTGLGLDDALRAEVWAKRHRMIGRVIKYRYQAHGTKDKPRMPVFLGFRDPRDM